MRFARCAAVAACAACLGFSSTAFAQADDDEEEGWIEETVEEEEEAAPPPPPPKKKAKKKKAKKKKVIIVEESVEEDTPPAWTLGRRGRPKKTIVARDGEAPPPGYHLEYRSRKNLWIPGVVLLASGYAASALSSATHLAVDSGDCWDWDYYCSSSGDWGWGFVPLVGPFVIAADERVDGGWRAGYALMGVAQNLGLALTIAGAASKRGVWVYDGRGRRSEAPAVELVAGPGNLVVKGAF